MAMEKTDCMSKNQLNNNEETEGRLSRPFISASVKRSGTPPTPAESFDWFIL